MIFEETILVFTHAGLIIVKLERCWKIKVGCCYIKVHLGDSNLEVVHHELKPHSSKNAHRVCSCLLSTLGEQFPSCYLQDELWCSNNQL